MHWKLSPPYPTPILLVCFLLLVGFASPSFGQDEEEESDDYGRPGWYLGANGLFALNAYRDTLGEVGDTGGANVRVGYRSESAAALEAEFEWIHHFDEDLGTVRVANYRSYSIGVNGKFFMTSGRIQPFALVGVGGLSISKRDKVAGTMNSSTDWGFRGGAGVDVYITRNIAANLEVSYLWAVGDVWKRDYASFGGGLLYRF